MKEFLEASLDEWVSKLTREREREREAAKAMSKYMAKSLKALMGPPIERLGTGWTKLEREAGRYMFSVKVVISKKWEKNLRPGREKKGAREDGIGLSQN
jgi:hypothetical protein